MPELTTTVFADAGDFALAERFALCAYWEPENADLFSADFTMALPYAPPGMLQTLSNQEVKNHFNWLSRTVSELEWTSEPVVLATDHPGVFWAFRSCTCRTFFGRRDGRFTSKLAAMLRIENGKIVFLKEHFDMAAFYDAIGVELPHFAYDAVDPASLSPRAPAPVIAHTEESLRRQVEATLNFFINPSYWDPEVNCVLADDFVHELVYAPADMPRVYWGTEYDAINEWLGRHMATCDVFDLAFYRTDDPHKFVAEFNCYASVTWGGCTEGGWYANREISYIELNDQGLCTRLDEYFNTMSKFNSIGASIPSFPYLY